MQRFLNDPNHYVSDLLSGLYKAHPQCLTHLPEDPFCLHTPWRIPGKVALITGGGSGHLPLFLGYVGEGMLDGCCVGDVFQSPSFLQIASLGRALESGAGVCFLYGNYSGNVLNFSMAQELLEQEGIPVCNLALGDDVVSASIPADRRGIAGLYYLYKCVGAAAIRMAPLQELERIAIKVKNNLRSMGVALSSCTIPAVGHPNFTIKEGSMALGMGIHGEPGLSVQPLQPAHKVAEELLTPILADLSLQADEEVAVLVNGLGATPREELYILFDSISSLLRQQNISVFQTDVGEFATSMEMAGASLSLLRLDDELKSLLLAPCSTPFFAKR